MPDLTIELFRMCLTNERWEARVTGSKGDKYAVVYGSLYGYERNRQGCEYGWYCSCQGFRIRGTCSHIKKADRLRCGWHEQWGGNGPEVKSDPDVEVIPIPVPGPPFGRCPACGGATRVVRCAV